MHTYLKKVLSVLLLMAFLVNICPVSAYAAGTAKDGASTTGGFMTNPLYPFLEETEQPDTQLENIQVAAAAAADYVSLEEAVEQLRDGMVAREETITLYISSTTSFDFKNDVFYRALDEDLAVGCTAGDYLRWSWRNVGWKCSPSGSNYAYTVSVTYYTTAEQETEFLNQMEAVLESLELDEKTYYEQYTVIYKYIGDHADYDFDALERVNNKEAQDDDYLIFTAYGALCEGDAVCQGYACLLYAMCRGAGLPVRLIHNDSHAWNIVGLREWWYNMDVTWDGQNEVTYKDYFLKGSDDFPNHTPDSKFLTEEFTTAYPISKTSFEPSEVDISGCTSHSYDDGVIVKEATCTEKGEKLYTCTVCGDTKTESIAALGHREISQTTEPTCTEQGYTTHTCENCGDSYIDSYTDAKGHDWDDGVVTKEATETEDGVMTYTCQSCGATYTETISATDHRYDEGVVTKEPTCEEAGVMTYTCQDCGQTKTAVIDPTGHSYSSVVTEPTCTERGYTTYTCSACGKTYTDDYTDALGHREISQTVEPTCTEDGCIMRVCSRCDYSYVEETIPALGHDLSASETVKPTCTESGYTIYKCSRCDYSVTKDETEPTGHSYVCTERQAATCTQDGYETYTCEACGDTRSESIAATGHSYTSVVTEPTCTEDGYTTHTCGNCGDSYTDSHTDAKGHDWDEGVITKEATDTEDGVMTYTCQNCGATYTEPVSATAHHYDEGVVTKEPTCEEAGVMTYTCQDCGQTKTTVIDPTGHSYTSVVTEPTCTEQGYTTYTCSACGKTYTDDYTDALGHQYDEGTVTVEPTATKEGRIRYTCERCQHSYVETIEATGNPFTDVDEKAYYYEAVLWAVDREITNGYPDGTFQPEKGCTRAQIVTFLWRYAGEEKPTSTQMKFADVPEDAYYYDAVLWAVENGITTGTTDTKFAPDETCTRAQIVTFLWRYAKKPEPANSTNKFVDVPEDAYYHDAVLWAVEKDITKGTTDTKFAPASTCTRGQAVTFLFRYDSSK